MGCGLLLYRTAAYLFLSENCTGKRDDAEVPSLIPLSVDEESLSQDLGAYLLSDGAILHGAWRWMPV